MIRRRFLLLTFLLLGLSLTPQQSHATHMQGVDLTYECLTNCIIRVHLRAYRNCGGAIGITNNVTMTPVTQGCNAPIAVSNWSQQLTTEVTPVCATVLTQCSTPGAQITGVQEYYWFRDYDICSSPNCIISISWGSCCRNSDITSGAANQGMGISATTINTNITPCNSSPQFTNPPVPYICAGQPYVFNQGAVDPEGDQLVYSLGPCYTNNGGQVTYAPGFSPTQPLGASWNVSINSQTGDITVIPQPGLIEIAVLCVYVEEWRNGVLINTIVRDVQINVISCPNNTLPNATGVQNVVGGTATAPWEVTVCAGTPLSLDVPVIDPDAGQTHSLAWDQNIQGATFTGGGQADTITGVTPTGQFNWTPPATGVYTFLVTMQDDACPIFGQNQYTVIINVQGGLPGASISAVPTGCTNVSLNANPGTGQTGPYTYSWFGDGNLTINQNAANQTLSHTYPGPGSYEVNVEITDAFGCVSILTDTVVIPNGPTADAGPDISVCSGYNVTLGSTNLPGGQTYLWAPGTGLSSTTISDPVLNYTTPGNQPDTLDFTVSATTGFCTSIDYVTVVVYPTPVATITGNNSICAGDQTTLTANGGTSYLWSTGETTQSITVQPSQTMTYSCTAIDNGCSSQPMQYTVTVTNGPSTSIAGDNMVCAGGDVTLTATGGSAWQWSTGQTTQSIVVGNVQGSTTVSVIASDNGCPGPPATFTIDLHEKPAANFAAPEVCDGATTNFNDQSTINGGSVVAWTWDFDDPNTGTSNTSGLQNPSHDFSGPGTYTVQLIVTADNGCLDTITHQIIVNPLPTPEFTFEDICLGERANFNDASNSAAGITGWLWDFGDGTTSTFQNAGHTFTTSGLHNVVLTVTDGNG
ncbi:MAG: PKD domain-containing protein, partial [Bacteroidota bacterium]